MADFLINHNLDFEGKIEFQAEQIAGFVAQKLNAEANLLDRAQRDIFYISKEKLRKSTDFIEKMATALPISTAQIFERNRFLLENAASISAALDPQRLLARGFSITYFDAKPVRSVGDVKPGGQLRTVVADGEFLSKT